MPTCSVPLLYASSRFPHGLFLRRHGEKIGYGRGATRSGRIKGGLTERDSPRDEKRHIDQTKDQNVVLDCYIL
jgi:hypothetical protein